MSENLVVNPYLQLSPPSEQDGDLFLIAPKPQSGLQNLQISQKEQANLHDLFLELAEIGFDYLDQEKDINQSERDLLYDAGILIEPEKVPEIPLFACPLNEVEVPMFDGDASALIVNPTFRFEPFNLANFLPWIHEKHLSPHKATVWIKQPLTEIEIGYWLDSDQAEAVAKFTAGEKLAVELDDQLISKLFACAILTTPEILARQTEIEREKINKARIKYQKDKYAVLPELLPGSQMKAMRRFYRQYTQTGFMPFGDPQVSRRYYQHNEPLAAFFHRNFAKLLSLVIGEEVIPSYVYAASYLENADLKPHIDRAQCEFSISFQVDYLPEPENNLSPWGLFVSPLEACGFQYSEEFPAKSEAEDQNTAVYLASGDGLIYKGCELVHYRYPLPAGHQSTSLFFHYVAKDFDGGLD